jgi:LysM repeat protein
MEFAIPISQFNAANVKWGQPRSHPFRRTIPFEYADNNINLNNLIISLDPLKIAEVDLEKNQLILEEVKKSSFLYKLDELQHNVSEELTYNAKKWVDETRLPAIIQSPLQQWLKSKKINLYLSVDPSSLTFFTEDGPAIFSTNLVKPGDTIRAVIKIHGLSLQMSENDNWTGKSRIQHNILQLYKVSTALN